MANGLMLALPKGKKSLRADPPGDEDLGPPPPPPADSSPHGQMMGSLGNGLASASARQDKTAQSMDLVGKARELMDGLMALGDSVTKDDIIEAAGHMVGTGSPPVAIASLMATCPPDPSGQALAGWVQAQDQNLRQKEALAQQAHAIAGHQLAAASMGHIVGHSIGQRLQTNSQALGGGPSPAPNAPSTPVEQ